MIRALVITHGRIGEELVRVLGMILGPHDGLEAMSNSHRSAQDITEAVKAWLDAGEPGAPAIILVDDYGGSCATASQLACAGRKDTAVLSGVNLAMILGFLTWRDSGDFPDLVSRLVAKGREAIVRLGAR